ncbi:MAG: radical SAM protein, partial [Novosphingobium sp.]|nr:radical SAM protein [Novosphingobium sp.]
SVREGRDNDPRFFSRMKPTGVWADLIRTRFRVACAKHGIGKAGIDLDCAQFRKPSRAGQLDLF